MFVIKFQHEDDIRRITVERCLPIKELIELARSLFRENIPQHFVLKYKDDEGDFVTITSDRELEEAFRLFKDSGILRLHVTQIEAPKPAHSPAPAPQQQKTSPLDDIVNTFTPFVEAMENEFKGVWPKLEQGCNEIYPKIEEQLKGFGETAFDTFAQVFDSNKKAATKPKEATVIHPAICDNCQERITGLRWKCLNCPDYDLCTSCKQQDVHTQHPDHQFLKLERALFKGTARGPCQRPASAPPTVTPAKEQAEIPLHVVEPISTAPLTPLRMVEKKQDPEVEEPKNATVIPLTPLRMVEKKVDEPKKEEPKISAFEAKLNQLEEMGFSDRPRNVQLLVKWNGDMVAVVKDLVE